VRLDELQERPAECLGMEKTDPVPSRSGAPDLVDQGDAASIQALEHTVDVLHAQRQMMERVAALFQELLQTGVAARRDTFCPRMSSINAMDAFKSLTQIAA